MAKQNEETQESETTQEPETRTEQLIEVSWREIQPAYIAKKSLIDAEEYFSSMLLAFEKRKASMLQEISTLEQSLYMEAESLRNNFKIDPSLTYELKIPDTSEEKAYFLRKDD